MDKSKIYKAQTKDEWYTPKVLIDYVNDLGYAITLDPATTDAQAKRLNIMWYYTKETNGLDKDWRGHNVWLNPPFSTKNEWIKKAREEVDKGDTKVFMLLPASLETAVYQEHILGRARIHIPNKRIAFIDETGKQTQSSAFTSLIFELTKEKCNEYVRFDVKKEVK